MLGTKSNIVLQLNKIKISGWHKTKKSINKLSITKQEHYFAITDQIIDLQTQSKSVPINSKSEKIQNGLVITKQGHNSWEKDQNINSLSTKFKSKVTNLEYEKNENDSIINRFVLKYSVVKISEFDKTANVSMKRFHNLNHSEIDIEIKSLYDWIPTEMFIQFIDNERKLQDMLDYFKSRKPDIIGFDCGWKFV